MSMVYLKVNAWGNEIKCRDYFSILKICTNHLEYLSKKIEF